MNPNHKTLFNTPLLLHPPQIIEAIERSKSGEFEDYIAKSYDNGYRIEGSTGILPIYGVLAQKPDWLHMLMGGAAIEQLKWHFQALLNNDDVHEIVLDIDSPGGYTEAVDDFAALVFASRVAKPIKALVNPMACSAAYWIASAAHEVILADSTVISGSIGVYITHHDFSKMDERWGVKITEITAGKYKAVTSPHKPLSKDGEKTLQSQVDYIYSLFANAVAKHRNLDISNLETWADGKIFIGQQAIDVGLADRISNYKSLIITGKGEEVMPEKNESPQPQITESYLQANCPQLLANIKTRAYEEGQKAGIETGTKNERARVMEIEALEKSPAFEGYAHIFTQAKKDGMSPLETKALICDEQMRVGTSLAQQRADQTQAQSMPMVKDSMPEVKKEMDDKIVFEAMEKVISDKRRREGVS